MDKFVIEPNTEFRTADYKPITLDEIIQKMRAFYNVSPTSEYRLSIGTDSMTYEETHFVLAIVLHRVGNGGIYFYKRMTHPEIKDLRTKLYTETQLSLDATELLIDKFLENDEDLYEKIHLSIHLDIGRNGPTKDLIRELEGWVTAMGYDCEIKPDSYAASSIANIYSK